MSKQRKGIVSMLLAALMVCAMLVPGAAADAPSNDPIRVPGIAAAGGPLNPSYCSDPLSPPGVQGGVAPQLPRWRSCIITLEPDSDGQGHDDAIGQAYWAHRDFWPPGGTRVTGRADTEADADRIPAVTDTEVKVWIWLQRRINGRWVVKAEGQEVRNYPIDPPNSTHEYDVDVVVRAPLYWSGAYWRTVTLHQVYRDGVRTGSEWQTTPKQWLAIYWPPPTGKSGS